MTTLEKIKDFINNQVDTDQDIDNLFTYLNEEYLAVKVSDPIMIKHKRWDIVYLQVFQLPVKYELFGVTYHEGATENQDMNDTHPTFVEVEAYTSWRVSAT